MSMLDESVRPLIAAERRQRITELIATRGSARVSDLTELFGVAEETIRRDFSRLEHMGVLHREHGGAVGAERPYATRASLNEREKAAIGRVAATFVAENTSVILDSGTTLCHLARHLTSVKGLSVITNALTNASILVDVEDLDLVMVGGVIRGMSQGAVGDLAVATLRDVRVDQTFLAAQNFSISGGVTYPKFEEVSVKRAMIESAREVTLLADHTKYGRDSLVRVAALSSLDRIITSEGIPESVVQDIRDLGVEVVIAPLD